VERHPVDSGGLHDYCRNATVLQPVRHPMQVGCETAEPSHRFYISVQRYRYVVFRTSYVNPRCMQIQRWKSLGCICFRSLHPSFACQTALPYRRLPKVKFDGLGPVANRFYETLQRGRANRPKPIDCHQITDRQKPEPYSETGTCGAKVASALAAEPRPRQHLIQKQFLAPLTVPRCPLLGNYKSMCSIGALVMARRTREEEARILSISRDHAA